MPACCKLIIFLVAFLAIFLFCPKKTLAVTITIDNFPSSISSDAFNVDVSIIGSNPGTNYLRVDLYKEGTTKYFGETWSGTSWYEGSDGNQYFPIAIGPESTASATIQGRVGNPTLGEYPGPGSFKLRIRRYTSSGNPASKDQQTPVDVQITVPIQSPTPSPSSSPSPSSAPASSPTSSPTPSPSLTPSPKAVKVTGATLLGKILGEESSPAGFFPWEATEEAKSQEATVSPRAKFISKLFLGLGLIFLVFSGVYLWYNLTKEKIIQG